MPNPDWQHPDDRKAKKSDYAETLQPESLPPAADETADVDPEAWKTIQFESDVAEQKAPPDLSASAEAIPGFRIVEELGRGAFGVVYKAVDEKLDRSVAIKLPLLNDVKLYDKYIVEARNAAKIEANGIVPVFQVGTTASGQPFVVQKMIEGCTLADMLEQGPLSVGQAAELALKMSTAIASAHSAGLVHRDLKPANILVDANGDPWVADFGLAVFEEDQKFRHGEFAGTPLYMAPEQLLGRADWLDGRADIWALGIILHAMLTGKPPFEATTFDKLKDQVLNRDPRPLNQRSPHIPVEMDYIFRRCCAKEVRDRYSSAHELATDLREFLDEWSQHEDASAASNARRPATSMQRRFMGMPTLRDRRSTLMRPAPKKVKPRTWWYLVPAGALAGLVVGAIAWTQWPEVEQPEEPPKVVDGSGDASVETPEVPPPPPELHVSTTAADAYLSINAALKAAQPGATILISPGTYSEILVIEQEVTLKGEGDKAAVELLGTRAAAVQVQAAGHLTLSNLTVDAEGSDVNTIDVLGGQLDLRDCIVKSKSLDCIHVRSDAALRVEAGCVFETGLHPAIFANQPALLEIRGSEFSFKSPTDEEVNSMVGVQVRGSGGLVQNCTFAGQPMATGIDWADAESAVTIEQCQFNGLFQAIAARNCSKLQVTGKVDNQIQACKYGVVANQCQGAIDHTAVFGSVVKNSVAFKLVNCNALELSDSRSLAMAVGLELQTSHISGTAFHVRQSSEYGLLLHDQSALKLRDSSVSESSQTGVFVADNSTVDLENCQITENQLAGIWINSYGPSLTARECQFERNGIGLLLTAGTSELQGGRVADNRTIGVLIREPVVPATPPETGDPQPLQLLAHQVEFAVPDSTASPTAPGLTTAAIYFTTVGNYKLEGCQIADAQHDNRPRLDANLIGVEQDGTTAVRER